MSATSSRGARAWLDARTGYRDIVNGIARIPMSGGASWSRALGNALVATLALQALGGLALMTVYSPAVTAAWSSVHFLSYTQPGGWLARGLHHWASHALVVLVVAHLGVAIARRSYRAPREVGFWLLLARGALVVSLAITGHALPWDQSGYWARRVELAIVGMTPFVGSGLAHLVQGGVALGQLALTRFYALHVGVLPLLLVALTLAQLAIERRVLSREAGAAGVDRPREELYFPAQAARDAVATLLVVAVALALTLRAHGAPLDAPADAASDYPARPEWFLLPLFIVRKLASGSREFLAVAGIPALVVGYLLALPWLDRKQIANRAAQAPFAGLVILALFAIGASVRHDGRDRAFQTAAAKADARAKAAIRIAKDGVPPEGPLVMLRRDPELRGEELFGKHCASCHILGALGDAKEAAAPGLDGFGTAAWVEGVLHDPDAPTRFGKTAYREMMPSIDVPPTELAADGPPFKPMSAEDKRATIAFLVAQGDEPLEGRVAPARDEAALARGEAVVRERCTTCHLYKGEGDDSGQEYAPELAGYGSIAWVRAQVANPATKATYREKALDPAMKQHMPRYDAELSPADIDIVARWTRAHGRGLAP